MQNIKALQRKIFAIQSEEDFSKTAMEIFHYQYLQNKVYRDFVNGIGIVADNVHCWAEIPFLPIELFKTHQVVSFEEQLSYFFASSGTTGINTSKHFIKDFGIYEESFRKGFQYFWGSPEQYAIIALLPSYLEQKNSSLVYMVSDLIKQSKYPQSGFYKKADNDLVKIIESLSKTFNPSIIFGVTYSLLDLLDLKHFKLPNTVIFETGGMKGRRKEMIRKELHTILCNGFGVEKIASEYGMAELFSQAYSKGDGIFQTPPWMKIRIRELNDPTSFVENGKIGGISVIDLANLHSCSFVATQDLGAIVNATDFQIFGRFDNSDVRGCNLLYE